MLGSLSKTPSFHVCVNVNELSTRSGLNCKVLVKTLHTENEK